MCIPQTDPMELNWTFGNLHLVARPFEILLKQHNMYELVLTILE